MIGVETWKPVVGYEFDYEVSDKGNVRSVDRFTSSNACRKGAALRKYVTANGYETVHLSHGGKRKTLLVHRLVAQAFIPNPYGKSQVNHKDGNKCNNVAENLEWVTPTENMQHAACMYGSIGKPRKLTTEQAEEIKKDERQQIKIAAEYGVSSQAISQIKRGVTYKRKRES